MKTIFVSGVHGAGKTNIAKSIAEKLRCEYYSCSDLIKKELATNGMETNWNKEKQVQGVEKNQSFLVQAVKRLEQNDYLVLDGHFTLIENDTFVPTLSEQDIEELGIILNIYVDTDADKVIKNMSQRDGHVHSKEFIQELIRSENFNRVKLLKSIESIGVKDFRFEDHF